MAVFPATGQGRGSRPWLVTLKIGPSVPLKMRGGSGISVIAIGCRSAILSSLDK